MIEFFAMPAMYILDGYGQEKTEIGSILTCCTPLLTREVLAPIAQQHGCKKHRGHNSQSLGLRRCFINSPRLSYEFTLSTCLRRPVTLWLMILGLKAAVFDLRQHQPSYLRVDQSSHLCIVLVHLLESRHRLLRELPHSRYLQIDQAPSLNIPVRLLRARKKGQDVKKATLVPSLFSITATASQTTAIIKLKTINPVIIINATKGAHAHQLSESAVLGQSKSEFGQRRDSYLHLIHTLPCNSSPFHGHHYKQRQQRVI